MKIFRDFEAVHSIRNAIVTTGSFDGVHLAHKVILERLKKLAKEIEGETVVITFQPHPAKVLYPETAGRDLRLINSEREKIQLLTKAGLDNLIIVNFTLEFSKTTSSEFVRNWLIQKLNARKIVIGFNHHFGHNREGDYQKLREMGMEFGFDVEEIPEQDIRSETISSGAIRQALQEGDIEKANVYLDHHYLIIGDIHEIVSGNDVPGFQGFVVDSGEENKLYPKRGGYAVSIMNDERAFPGICQINDNNENNGSTKVELYLFDDHEPFIGKEAVVLFHKRIRDHAIPLQGISLREQLLQDRILIESLIL